MSSNLIDGYTFAVANEGNGRDRVERVLDLFERATGLTCHLVLDGSYFGIQFGTEDGFDFVSQRDAQLIERADNDHRLPMIRTDCWATITKRLQWERESDQMARDLWVREEARKIHERIDRDGIHLSDVTCSPRVHDEVLRMAEERLARQGVIG